ncbi:hypothetical protein FACS1894198_3050 [Clostridia bacterium]|nr:hypothetical protein FACS1894198_3050 [Clostridia bacterium]
MKKNKKFQKVLCVSLAIATVSSTITPTAYAAFLPTAILQRNGMKALVVDTTEKGCENQAGPNGGYLNPELFGELLGINDLNPDGHARDGTAYRIVVFAMTAPGTNQLPKLVLGLVPTKTKQSDETQIVLGGEINQISAKGLQPGQSRVWTIKAGTSASQEAERDIANVEIPVTRVEFGQPINPITVDNEHEHGVTNGLLGTQKNILLRLMAQEQDPVKRNAVAGCCREIYRIAKEQTMPPPGCLSFLQHEAMRVDLAILLYTLQRTMIDYFQASDESHKSAQWQQSRQRYIRQLVLRTAVPVLTDRHNPAADENANAIAAYRHGQQNTANLISLLKQHVQQFKPEDNNSSTQKNGR